MDYKNQIQMMKDLYTMQGELLDFCEECIKHIFTDEKRQRRALLAFEEGIQGIEYNGCIQGLCCIISNLENEDKRMEECKKEQADKNK